MARKQARRKGRRKAPRRPARSWRRRLTRLGIALVAVAVLLPPLQVASLRLIDPPYTGTRLQRAVAALAVGEGPGQRHQRRSLDEIDPDLVQAVLVSEDQRFWIHDGFDTREVSAALAEQRRTGKLRGASTLTMQCARTLFLWQGRSWTRKGLEAVYTLWMELLLPKERILELYLNEVEWGPSVFGAGAAVAYHLGGDVGAVEPDQACRLAAVLPSPRERSVHQMDAATSFKADWVCGQMSFPLPRE